MRNVITDLRIEYETREGALDRVDLEPATEHCKGSQKSIRPGCSRMDTAKAATVRDLFAKAVPCYMGNKVNPVNEAGILANDSVKIGSRSTIQL
jgi:hypothetical protein